MNLLKHKLLNRLISIILIPAILAGCSSYRLSNQIPRFNVDYLEKSTHAVCAVENFKYTPTDKSETDLMSQEDLTKWNQLFFDSINYSGICGRTVKASELSPQDNVKYIVDGEVKAFYFKKNWIPMFIPVWLGLTFFSLGIYALAAGPITTSMVNFGFTVNIKDAKTGKLLAFIPESFKSTDIQTIYSNFNKNPYGNPGLAFSPTVNDSIKKISDAIRRTEPEQVSGGLVESLQKLHNEGVLTDSEYNAKLNQAFKNAEINNTNTIPEKNEIVTLAPAPAPEVKEPITRKANVNEIAPPIINAKGVESIIPTTRIAETKSDIPETKPEIPVSTHQAPIANPEIPVVIPQAPVATLPAIEPAIPKVTHSNVDAKPEVIGSNIEPKKVIPSDHEIKISKSLWGSPDDPIVVDGRSQTIHQWADELDTDASTLRVKAIVHHNTIEQEIKAWLAWH
jgi:hypothetical protein